MAIETGGLESILLDTCIDKVGKFLEDYKDNMNKQELKDYLNSCLIDRDMDVIDVVNGSNIEKSYVYAIFNGKKKNPSRNILISIAFGLKLSLDETQKMLKIAHHQPLYVKESRDVIIFSALNSGLDLQQTNAKLIENDFEPLGSVK